MRSVAALRPFVRAGTSRPREAACELCSGRLGDAHRHVVDRTERRLCCVCEACGCLFVRASGESGRYRTVPDRVLFDPELSLTVETWSTIGIPVGLAFLFRSSAAERWIATFPSPAGATEAELDDSKWHAFASKSPLFGAVEEDVEALLVRGHSRDPSRAFDCYLVPIDVCYRLIATVRTTFRGFDGGDAAREAIDALFLDVARRGKPVIRPEAIP